MIRRIHISALVRSRSDREAAGIEGRVLDRHPADGIVHPFTKIAVLVASSKDVLTRFDSSGWKTGAMPNDWNPYWFILKNNPREIVQQGKLDELVPDLSTQSVTRATCLGGFSRPDQLVYGRVDQLLSG